MTPAANPGPARRPKAYVINLERAQDRRARIGAALDALGLDWEIFNAVDGRLLDDRALAKAYDADGARSAYREMSRGEVACALSHLGVYRKMLDDGAAHALILEDDALPRSDLPRVLDALAAAIRADEPEVVLLTHVDKYTAWGSQPLGGPTRLVRRYHEWWRAHGYLVTRAAAQRMLESLQPVRSAADQWSRFEREGIVRVRAVVPYCIGLSDLAADSSLEAHRAEKDRADKDRRSLSDLLYHYGYRRFVHQLLVRPFLRVSRQKQRW